MSETSPSSSVRRRRRINLDSGLSATIFSSDGQAGVTREIELAMKDGGSQQLVDPFTSLYESSGDVYNIIRPPFNPTALMKLANESNILRQCVQAMVTNCEAFGGRMDFIGEDGDEDSPEATKEREWAAGLLDSPNGGEYDFTDLRKRMRTDLETLGYGYIECTRDAKNDINMMWHVPGNTIRLTGKDGEIVPVKRLVKRRGVEQTVTVGMRFRRYVQQVGLRKRYFKEFGDPRTIDPSTGAVDPSLSLEEAATELLCFSLYSPGSVYGMPRWVHQMPAIMGSRESELTNLEFFRDNAIPAMAILVSGGAVTQASLDLIEQHFTSQRGRQSNNRMLVLEATGDEAGASQDGTIPVPRLDMKPLARERQSDELFQKYDENNQRKVRSAFRLPPIFVGLAEDHTRATAQDSMVVAENQIFGPERSAFDEIINTRVLVFDGRPMKYWRYRSNPPRMVGADQITTAMEGLDKLGAMTPNIAIGIANELFDMAIRPIPEEWGDLPFALVKAMVNTGAVVPGLEAVVQGTGEGGSNTNASGNGDDASTSETNTTDQLEVNASKIAVTRRRKRA